VIVYFYSCLRTNCLFCPLFASLSFLGAFLKLREATISFVISARSFVRQFIRRHGATRLSLDRFSLNLTFEYFSNKNIEKTHVPLTSDNKNSYFTCRTIYIFYHISLSSYWNGECFRKFCRGNQDTHFVFSNFFFSENRAVYEIIWKGVIQPERPQMTIWRTRIAYWVPKATDTHSQYVTLIVFPLQQWLHESALILTVEYILINQT
jgi:hypothetical protein